MLGHLECVILGSTFSTGTENPNGDCMQTLHPQEVDVSSNHAGAHKPFGVSSFGGKVLDV
jgi:hypothetical protein